MKRREKRPGPFFFFVSFFFSALPRVPIRRRRKGEEGERERGDRVGGGQGGGVGGGAEPEPSQWLATGERG